MQVELKNLGTVNRNRVFTQTDKYTITLYFSYETVVGFETVDKGSRVIENLWSNTTGKLLNYIQPNKKLRLKEEQFKRELQEELSKL